MAKCNRDCFNCKFDDCVVNGITSEERSEIRERDKKIVDYGHVLKAIPNRAIKRKKYYAF